MKKRNFLSMIAATLVLGLAGVSPAQAQYAVVPGRDFKPIQPAQPTDSAGKIEVLEFFSYGCIHCAHFHPVVSKWAAALPADVAFKRVPVSFGRAPWRNLSRLFYAAEATGTLPKVDSAAFDAIHQKGVKLYDDGTIAEFAAQQGLDARRFADAYGSREVAEKVQRADQMTNAYRIEGTPSITVDGRYLVPTEGIKDWDDYIGRVNRVIAKLRSERKK